MERAWRPASWPGAFDFGLAFQLRFHIFEQVGEVASPTTRNAATDVFIKVEPLS